MIEYVLLLNRKYIKYLVVWSIGPMIESFLQGAWGKLFLTLLHCIVNWEIQVLSPVQPSWDIQAVSAPVSFMEDEYTASLSPAWCALAVRRQALRAGVCFWWPLRRAEAMTSPGQCNTNAVSSIPRLHHLQGKSETQDGPATVCDWLFLWEASAVCKLQGEELRNGIRGHIPAQLRPGFVLKSRGWRITYDSGAQCAGSRQEGQLDLAVHTILAGEEFKVLSSCCISLFQNVFWWKEGLLPCQELGSL